jgi:protocatechuate 3,4-dioxygenase beta subunit
MAKGYHAQFITNLELKSKEVTLNFYLESLDPSVTNFLAGTVFKEQTNTPVSNAVITLTNLDGPEILYRTRTNREGYYQFTSIYPGNYELSAVARGFQEFRENIEIRHNSWITEFNIYLKPIISDILVTLHGNVWEVGSELKAVYPAQIILIGVLASGEAAVYYTENNPDGSYKIENIIPSNYLVICAAPGYQTKIIRNFPLYQPLHQLDFYLSPITYKWGYISGKIYFDRLGTPVHGAKIRFISENAKYHHTASDIDGKYIVRLPVGKYYVLCSYRDPNGYNYYQEYYDDVHSIADATPVAVEENQITPHIDFGIPYPSHQLSVTISGRVTDNDDMPLGKALVKAWQINVPSFSCDKQIYFAWTDDDGKYEINFDLNLHNMTRPTPLYGFIVSAEKDDYKTEFYDEKPAPYLADILWVYQDTVFTDIDFTLDPKDAPNSISGIITSADDNALAHAFVLGVNSRNGEIVFTYSNNLGQYTLCALKPDYYYLLFTAAGHVPEFYNDVHNWEDATPVLANGTVEGIDASLTPIYWDVYDGIVAGVVCDNTGRALAGALITVKNEQGLVVGYTLTDAAGGYEITGISDGNYQVFATKVNYVTQISPIDFNSVESEMLVVNFTMDETLTKLPDNGNDQINLPTSIKLLANYPNPFNPLTHIQFAVPSAQRVRLVIYDILGRQVKNVLNDMLPAGWYTVQWDATDNRGEGVSAGVYFYSMETAEQRIVKKLVYYK